MKIYCNVYNNCKKFKKPKVSDIFEKILDPFIFHSKYGHEYQIIFKEEDSIETLKVIGLIINIEEYQKLHKHVLENTSQEFRLKNIDETRSYFNKEINQNELISKKHKYFLDSWIIFNTCLT